MKQSSPAEVRSGLQSMIDSLEHEVRSMPPSEPDPMDTKLQREQKLLREHTREELLIIGDLLRSAVAKLDRYCEAYGRAGNHSDS